MQRLEAGTRGVLAASMMELGVWQDVSLALGCAKTGLVLTLS
jgi:hypothetical protein